MTFIKPSTVINQTGAYIYKGGVSDESTNYIDNNFPNILDKTGDTITGIITTDTDFIFAPGATAFFETGSFMTLTQGSLINGNMTIGGSLALQNGTLTGPTTFALSSGHSPILCCNSTSGVININLPSCGNANFAFVTLTIKDVSGTAKTNNINLVPNGTDTIEGLNSTYIMSAAYSQVVLSNAQVGSTFKWILL